MAHPALKHSVTPGPMRSGARSHIRGGSDGHAREAVCNGAAGRRSLRTRGRAGRRRPSRAARVASTKARTSAVTSDAVTSSVQLPAACQALHCSWKRWTSWACSASRAYGCRRHRPCRSVCSRCVRTTSSGSDAAGSVVRGSRGTPGGAARRLRAGGSSTAEPCPRGCCSYRRAVLGHGHVRGSDPTLRLGSLRTAGTDSRRPACRAGRACRTARPAGGRYTPGRRPRSCCVWSAAARSPAGWRTA